MGIAEPQTERVRLDRPLATDAPGVFAILGDARTVEHNPSELLNDEGGATELVSRWIRHWDEHGFGYWCARLPGEDRIIGYVGVKRMTVRARPVLNLVYRLAPDAWGRGLATEAVAGVVSRVAARMPAEVILARVRPGNLASQNVAVKVGLRRDIALDDHGEDGLDWAFTNRVLS
ncbi:GNAT family N-acetyltransferase [Phycicoccus sp. KQZ13P-1]|uniref:GNAT family N-acetyltransferase n=1 Tax=Phycicoccus mangrovi TaxID=2840470 RepID=UPI001C008588|nr:GNAT family N-acetyltransferase [Phycicoccus mangrovi]MBT9255295.1 GNAT family N-acetyltransferase [Phycicoccus mangrovi]